MNKLRYYYCIYLFLSIFALQCSNQVVVQPFVDFKTITPEVYALLLASTDVSASEASTQKTIRMSTIAYLAFSGRMDLFPFAAAKGYPIYPQEMINICVTSNISYDLLVTLVSLRNENALKVLFQGRSFLKGDLENICWSHKWFPDCIFKNG